MKQQRERITSEFCTQEFPFAVCSLRKDLQWARRIHAKTVESRNNSNIHVVTALIKMYGKCGSMVDAHRVFDSVESPYVTSWTALLLGYAENGKGHAALNLFCKMKACGHTPDSVTYVAALKACASLAKNGFGLEKSDCLKWGKKVHLEIGCPLNYYIESTLIDMYAKCGSINDARQVFDRIPNPDVVSWTALILGYVENGEGLSALQLFSEMKTCGYTPNSVTYVAALKACTSLAVNQDASAKADCVERGTQIHLEIGSHLNHYVQTALIDMYATCGCMAEARRVFNNIQKPDVVCWNALLMGYAENGEGLLALEMFSRMKAGLCAPNSTTFVSALKACTSLILDGDEGGKKNCLQRGRQIHSEIGTHLNLYVMNTLIDMYAKCGNMFDARRVFNSIQSPDIVSWNALLLGYAENGQGDIALDLFTRLKARGYASDSVTYVSVLKACISLIDESRKDCLERGKELHLEIGGHMDSHVQNTLIDMYAKCGSMADAQKVFDSIQHPNVVAWNVLLLGYADNGEGAVCLDLFFTMKRSGYAPNSITYLAAVRACTSVAGNANLQQGRKIHSEIGCHMDRYIQSTLIDMYAKCGSMIDARRVFESMQNPDVVSWNILLLGYTDNGEELVALDLFSLMKVRGYAPNSLTYMAALKACGLTGSLALGRKFHVEMLVLREFTCDVVTCLVDFYAKCGSMIEARQVFDLHARARDVSTWNALLAGYSRFDYGSMVDLFDTMQDEGFRPNAATFACMLLCFSHTGLVQKAKEYFEAMPVKYAITPSVVHYNCMVDALGRANQVNEAIVVLRGMPCNPDAVTWRVLLSACHKWKNVEIGKLAFQSLVDMNKDRGSAYILMANMYGSKGMWEDATLKKRIMDGLQIGHSTYTVEFYNMLYANDSSTTK